MMTLTMTEMRMTKMIASPKNCRYLGTRGYNSVLLVMRVGWKGFYFFQTWRTIRRTMPGSEIFRLGMHRSAPDHNINSARSGSICSSNRFFALE